MNTYKFYQDIKLTVWNRQFFDIEAETAEEAKQIALKYRDEDVLGSDEYKYREASTDSEENMTPEENGGAETIRLYLYGENEPFATNALPDYKVKNISFDSFKTSFQVARSFLEKKKVEAVWSGDGNIYHAFHENGKLCIVSQKPDGISYLHTFNSDFFTLVYRNTMFRMKLVAILMTGYSNSELAEQLDKWLKVVKTDEEQNDANIYNSVPFNLSNVVTAGKNFATMKVFTPTSLVGYRVKNAEGHFPEGLNPNHVFANMGDALAKVKELDSTHPCKDKWQIYPVYGDDLDDFSY